MPRLLLSALLLLAFVACTGTDITGHESPDGDTDKSADGDDKPQADGDWPEDGDRPDGDEPQDGDEPEDGDTDGDELDGDQSDGDDSDGDVGECRPDSYQCLGELLYHCDADGGWRLFRDCPLYGRVCRDRACVDPPAEDGDEPDGDEDGDEPDGDEPDGDADGDEDGDSDGGEIDPEDVVIGEACPEHGIQLCIRDQTIAVCRYDLIWVKGVKCTDYDKYCHEGDCIRPDDPDYPGCSAWERYCAGTVLYGCLHATQDWGVVVDCANSAKICLDGECVHP